MTRRTTAKGESLRWTPPFLAACSGLTATLAFPAANISALAWIALVPLVVAIRIANPLEAFRLGSIMGITHALTLVYWLAPTMHTYGHLPWSLCGVVLLLFSLYLALYSALFGWLLNSTCRSPATLLLGVPVFWVGLEYLRGTLFTGFPWEYLGYSQFLSLHLIQISDIFGVYGVSLLLTVSNAAAAVVILWATGWSWKQRAVSARAAAGGVLAFSVLLTFVLGYGQRQMDTYGRIIGQAPQVRVSVVQGNIPQAAKWDPAFAAATVHKYNRLSQSARPEKPDLVVWPETATPFYFLSEVELTEIVLQGIRNAGAPFLLGSPTVIPGPGKVRYYNSAYLIGPEGDVRGRYDKVHLVPFGEYVPMRRWLPFLGKMVAQVGDFDPGETGRTLNWQGTGIGIQICYEAIFPQLAREMTHRGARLLAVLTNDAWYGRTSAPQQHFSMAVFRAVENRRALVRAANTGISGFIDPLGRIMAATPLFTEAVETRALPLLSSKTLYTQFGDVLPGACAAAVLICAGMQVLCRWHRRRVKKKGAGA